MIFSVRAMATALGVSKSQVARDKQEGMPMDGVEAARLWRQAHHDVSRTAEGRIDKPGATNAPPAADGGLASAAGAGKGGTLPANPDIDADEPLPDDTADYRKARTAREQIRRDRERLDLDEQRGRLIDASEAARLAFTSFRALRDAAQQVSARVAPQCAVETDALRIEQLIDAEISAAFARFNPEHLLLDADADDEAE